MKLQTITSTFFSFILEALHMHIFLMLMSWPILIWWGLPLSLMSPLANFMFSPVMTLFLFISSLVFFCELLYIPSGWLLGLLETVSSWWLWVIKQGSSSWLIGAPVPHLVLLGMLPLGTVFIIRFTRWSKPLLNLVLMSLFGAVMGMYVTKIFRPLYPLVQKIKTSGNNNLLLYGGKECVGVIGATGLEIRSLDDWVEYTLKPDLMKIRGSFKIDHTVIERPQKTSFECARALCEHDITKKIYIKTWKEKIPGPDYYAYQRLKESAAEKKVLLKYFDDDLTIEIGRGSFMYSKDGSAILNI